MASWDIGHGVKFEPRGDYLREIALSRGVGLELYIAAKKIAEAASAYGGHYKADLGTRGQFRGHAWAATDGRWAERANAKYGALENSIDAGRL